MSSNPQFEEFKARIMQQWGLGGGEQVSGPAMSGTTQADRFQQQAGRGTAPFSAGGLLAAGSNALGLMGGMGAVMGGLGSMAELGTGSRPGSLGGIQNIPGYRGIPPEKQRLVGNLVDFHEARDAAMRGGGGIGSGTGRTGGGQGERAGF